MIDAYRLADVVCVTIVVFLGFEIALGLNYVALKFVLRAMKLGLRGR
jgi:hypothetical protein